MGCDIHLFAEAKTKKSLFQKIKFWEAPKWKSIEKWEIDDEEEPPRLTIRYERMFYNGGRNYNLFCALCGVRRFEFTGKPPFISAPKGIPNDTCDLIKKEVESYGSDGHSYNYNTLKELKEFDWSSYGETCNEFLNEVLPKMEAVGVPDSDVRIVYFFDN